jgi:ribosomal protein S18 acetylase RimI-like enzyme
MNNKLTLEFKQADTTDLDFLTKKTLALHHFEMEGGKNNLEIKGDVDRQIKQWLTLELEIPSSLIFVLTIESKPIGFAFLKVQPSNNNFTEYDSYGLIQSIWIDEEYQKQSFGKQTVKLIESIFREQDIPYYEVNYSNSNHAAKSFWESCGLEEASTTARKFLK